MRKYFQKTSEKAELAEEARCLNPDTRYKHGKHEHLHTVPANSIPRAGANIDTNKL